MNYEYSDCGIRPQCSYIQPGSGSYSYVFTCIEGKCESEADGVSCDSVDFEDCTPCDRNGTGDGRCEIERCSPLGAGAGK